MRNKILINLLILTGLSAYTAQAQEGWTLRRCIDYAIEHNRVPEIHYGFRPLDRFHSFIVPGK